MGSVQYFTEETAGYSRSPEEPVTHIAWVDAVVWCNALSELFGLEPVYVDKDSGEVWRDAGGHRVDSYEPYAYANTGRYHDRPIDTGAVIELRALTGRPGFRLPSLAEMEALTDKNASPENGWFRENSGGRTHPVGTQPANALGLFDVEGNVQVHTWGGGGLFGQIRFGKSFADHSGTYPHPMTRKENPFVGRSYVGFRPVRRAQ
jgi:formylglycine-generating enzyme required for sulfatase activity